MESRICGIGIDMVEIKDVARARFKERVAEYFLTPEEMAPVFGPKSEQYLASRFAAKEAVIKAFPDALSPMEFRIEKNGIKPVVYFLAPQKRALYIADISLTHTRTSAAAVAIIRTR
ncbi:MAG: 4'-phosphopantetheinyl transferase superfamily protein [Patescibacteria group bacterium]